MFTENDFKGITTKQKQILENYYLLNPKRLSSHKSSWKSFYKDDQMMININAHFDSQHIYQNQNYEKLEIVTINDIKYICMSNYWSIALFNYETNNAYTYELITWKNTKMKYWSNTNSGYLGRKSGESIFRYWHTINLQNITSLDEYKYIDISKIKRCNPYILLNERFNKSKLWQIEMLIKQNYLLLAEDLSSSYSTIDFKVFREYLDFFNKKGKRLDEYNKIIQLRNLGFTDPEYLYLQRYLGNTWGNWFVEFLTKHSEVNRNRFLKYIKNRKGQKTKFGINFLRLYQMYLLEIEDLNLDLSKDKYAFPQDLIKSMEDHLLSINPYEYKGEEFKSIFEAWQSTLPKDQQSDLYLSRIIAFKKQEKQRVLLAKKRAEQRQKFLKFLWSFNKNIKYSINDTYVLIAPTSSEDLIIEGKTLNHCVGAYVESISKKETSIYFLRKKEYIDKPFYTVEIKNGKLQQCRSTNNQVNPDITSLLNEWITQTNHAIPSWDIESETKYAQ